MSYPKEIWEPLKGITCERLMKALKDDAWEKQKANGNRHPFKKEANKGKADRVVIHYHKNKTYGQNLLKGLLEDIGWTTEDLVRLNLIKLDKPKTGGG